MQQVFLYPQYSVVVVVFGACHHPLGRSNLAKAAPTAREKQKGRQNTHMSIPRPHKAEACCQRQLSIEEPRSHKAEACCRRKKTVTPKETIYQLTEGID